MYFRTFFFLLFILSSILFFISSYNITLTLNLCGSMCEESLSLQYIQLTSMNTAALSLLLFLISNHYTEKKILKEKERLASDRLTIEKIHAELEALKK